MPEQQAAAPANTPPAAPAGGGKLPTDEEVFQAGFTERSQQLSKKKQPLAQSL